MIATFGVIPKFKSITIESDARPAEWGTPFFLADDSPMVDGWIEVVTTFISRGGREYVGTNMTEEEIREWEALLSGDGEP